MTLTEVADYFRLLVDEPDRTFLTDKQVSMIMKQAYNEWNHLVRDNDDSLDDYFLPIQNPGQIINLYGGPNNLIQQPPYAGLNVNGSSAGVRLMRITAVTDLNFNGSLSGSGAYNPGRPPVYAVFDTSGTSSLDSVTVNSTTLLSSSYTSSAAFITASLNLISSSGGSATAIADGAVITGPFQTGWTFSLTSTPSGSIQVLPLQSGLTPSGTPNSSTPSIWTIAAGAGDPTGAIVSINGTQITYTTGDVFLTQLFNTVVAAGGYVLFVGGNNPVITIYSPLGAGTMTVSLVNNPGNVLTLNQTQVGSGVNSGINLTATSTNFSINKVYEAASSITELANSSEQRYFYQNGSLWFNYPPQNGIIIWYSGIQEYDFTKIALNDAVYWDQQLTPYHDILALIMAKIYTIKDISVNQLLREQLNIRTTQLKEYLSQGIDIKAHQYVSQVKRVGYGYRY